MIVVPDPGMAPAIGRLLLDLAEHPRDVQWVSWPEGGFKVSDELFAMFKALEKVDKALAADAPEPAETSQPPKRRGRPRKQPVQDTDDTAHKEE